MIFVHFLFLPVETRFFSPREITEFISGLLSFNEFFPTSFLKQSSFVLEARQILEIFLDIQIPAKIQNTILNIRPPILAQ